MTIKNSLLVVLSMITLLSSCGEDSSNQGDTYFAQERFEDATAAYDSFLASNPRNVKALYNRGRAHEELGNIEKAEEDFKRAYELDNTNVQVMMSLSNLYQRQKNHTNALLYADYAVEQPGAPAMAYFLKARALHQLGNTDEALIEYSAAIKNDGEFAQAYYYRGLLKLGTQKVKGGCEDINLALTMNFTPAQAAKDKYCN